LNGPDDGTADLIASFKDHFPETEFVVLRCDEVGLAQARNLGLHTARFSYFTNIDDDDWVSPTYLEKLLAYCSEDSVAMTYVCDVAEDSHQTYERFNNYLCRGILPYAGRSVSANRVPVGSADAAKAAPTALGQQVLYDEAISSGLDVVFWSQLVARNALTVRILEIHEHAIYYRLTRTGSMSRSLDRQFVEDRFRVITRLLDLTQECPAYKSMLRRSIGGQVTHLGRAAQARPDWYPELSGKIRSIATPGELAAFNHAAARTVAVCYVYTPYNDASAIVAAKRLTARDEPFDVICHSMGALRAEDSSLIAIDAPLLGQRVVLEGPASTGSWHRLAEFCADGATVWENLAKGRAPYDNVYSRAQWPFSHALAALMKVRQPGIRWTAEFSDPLSVAIDGTPRPGNMGEFPERTEIEDAARGYGFDLAYVTSLSEWVELVAYALADELVFTNENQKEFMLSRIGNPVLADQARKRAVVAPHPGVPAHIMDTIPAVPKPDDGKIHIADFGRFYYRRGADDVLLSLSKLPSQDRRRIMLHLFVPANQVEQVRQHARAYRTGRSVRIEPHRKYLDYLATARSMDWVLVVDSQVSDVHGMNPYLPSKYAEYASLGVKIWGLIEPGSPLSRRRLDMVSTVGNPAETYSALEQILAEPDGISS